MRGALVLVVVVPGLSGGTPAPGAAEADADEDAPLTAGSILDDKVGVNEGSAADSERAMLAMAGDGGCGSQRRGQWAYGRRMWCGRGAMRLGGGGRRTSSQRTLGGLSPSGEGARCVWKPAPAAEGRYSMDSRSDSMAARRFADGEGTRSPADSEVMSN